MKTRGNSLFLFCAAGALLTFALLIARAQPAASESDDLRAVLEMFRSDVNSAKIRTLNQVMGLTASEADKFWPIYREYEKELATVGDRKVKLLREFAAQHSKGTLNDENSRKMAQDWLKNVQDRLDLWKKYHGKISDGVSPIRAAQFLQVEHQMALFIDLNIASEMPAIQPGGGEKKK